MIDAPVEAEIPHVPGRSIDLLLEDEEVEGEPASVAVVADGEHRVSRVPNCRFAPLTFRPRQPKGSRDCAGLH